jgi:fluoroquinolone transport system permease protein
MTGLASAIRWDIVVQARNGFYWATAFLVIAVGGMLLALPAGLRADRAAWVPAILVVNLQITTFFFVTGLLLLERDEGTLAALAVTPFSPVAYVATRTMTLTGLAAVETMAVVWIAFGIPGSWPAILLGTIALGVTYTGFGLALGSRYASVNTLLLPASVVATLLLLPLLPHFGFASRVPFLWHPIEPPLALIRAGYLGASPGELMYATCGSAAWGTVAFLWGRRAVRRLMRETTAGGGR